MREDSIYPFPAFFLILFPKIARLHIHSALHLWVLSFPFFDLDTWADLNNWRTLFNFLMFVFSLLLIYMSSTFLSLKVWSALKGTSRDSPLTKWLVYLQSFTFVSLLFSFTLVILTTLAPSHSWHFIRTVYNYNT